MSDEIDPEIRVKRARMRAWRRGMREMDLTLGRFADARAASLDARGMEAFESLLERKDQDLYAWLADRPGGEPDDTTAAERTLMGEIRTYVSAFPAN